MKSINLIWVSLFTINSSLFSVSVFGKHLPDGVEICSKSAPDFNDCFARTMPGGMKLFVGGNKNLGLPPLEPLLLKSLDLGESRAGSVSLNQKYENVNMFGLTVATITGVDGNFSAGNCYWRLNVTTPHIRIEADYQIKGKILFFELNSKGKCENTFLNVSSNHYMNCEHYEKKGQKHIRILDYVLNNTRADFIRFRFDNIVPGEGNERIGEGILATINENAQKVYADIRKGFEDSLSVVYMNMAERVFTQVPENEIFLD